MKWTVNAEDYIENRLVRITDVLEKHLPKITLAPVRLHTAMRYTVLNAGKRLRPLLVYAAGEAFGANLDQLDNAACAVEFIHTYSLVHDDLPAMDNDDFRRGQASCHKAFDEATAILAGDALQVLAFEVLLAEDSLKLNALQRLQVLAALTRACGSHGMVGGQALEFELLTTNLTIEQLEKIHHLKTGALIRSSVQLGAIIAEINQEQTMQLDRYATCLGLAFQIQDDILDHDTDKTSFSYVVHLGISKAQNKVRELYQQAISALIPFGDKVAPLHWLAKYIIEEKYQSVRGVS